MNPKVNVKRWQPHLVEAMRQGKSIKAYANEQGLSRHTLYAAAKALRSPAAPQAGTPRGPKSNATGFVAVRLNTCCQTAPPIRLRAQLPNGVVLHLDAAHAGELAPLLNALGGLTCSA